MKQKNTSYLVANFGGPRSLDEVELFLRTLLTDQDVVRTGLPKLIHRILFNRIAKKRARKVTEDYKAIGGKSPIYDDTEAVAGLLRERLNAPVMTFHRYIPASYSSFLDTISKNTSDEIRIFPMFPQFTYATTGSIARWFDQHLPEKTVNKMRWIKSYPAHPAFVRAHQNHIKNFLTQQELNQEDIVLLFSAHGVPKKFVVNGDLYEDECQASFNAIMEAFPNALGRLAYQSKFGPGEWLKPYTSDVCEEIRQWNDNRKYIVFVPISFTSDHIETLFEIEQDYMPIIKEKGLNALRLPALTLNADWVEAIAEILRGTNLCSNQMLIRRGK